jgi:hypothetical protein
MFSLSLSRLEGAPTVGQHAQNTPKDQKGVEALASCKAFSLFINHGPKGPTPEMLMNRSGPKKSFPNTG